VRYNCHQCRVAQRHSGSPDNMRGVFEISHLTMKIDYVTSGRKNYSKAHPTAPTNHSRQMWS